MKICFGLGDTESERSGESWSLGPLVRLSAGSKAANRANAAGAGGLLLDLQQFASEPSPSGRLGCNFPSLLNIYMVKLLHFSLLASRAPFFKTRPRVPRGRPKWRHARAEKQSATIIAKFMCPRPSHHAYTESHQWSRRKHIFNVSQLSENSHASRCLEMLEGAHCSKAKAARPRGCTGDTLNDEQPKGLVMCPYLPKKWRRLTASASPKPL